MRACSGSCSRRRRAVTNMGFDARYLWSPRSRRLGFRAGFSALAFVHQWLAATFPRQAQDEYWSDPDVIAAGSSAPVGNAASRRKSNSGGIAAGTRSPNPHSVAPHSTLMFARRAAAMKSRISAETSALNSSTVPPPGTTPCAPSLATVSGCRREFCCLWVLSRSTTSFGVPAVVNNPNH